MNPSTRLTVLFSSANLRKVGERDDDDESAEDERETTRSAALK
jgi:hypothetical protein